MGVTVPSIKPLNFSQDEKGSLMVQEEHPSTIRQLPFSKRRVAEGPFLTANPMEMGGVSLIRAFASGTSSHRFSKVPSTANKLT